MKFNDLTEYLFSNEDKGNLIGFNNRWRSQIYDLSGDFRQAIRDLIIEKQLEKLKTFTQSIVALVNQAEEPSNRRLLKQFATGKNQDKRMAARDELTKRLNLSHYMETDAIASIAKARQITAIPGNKLTLKDVKLLVQALCLPVSYRSKTGASLFEHSQDFFKSYFGIFITLKTSARAGYRGGHAYTRQAQQTPGVDNSCQLHSLSEVFATMHSIKLSDLKAYLKAKENKDNAAINEIDRLEAEGYDDLLDAHISEFKASKGENSEMFKLLKRVQQHLNKLDFPRLVLRDKRRQRGGIAFAVAGYSLCVVSLAVLIANEFHAVSLGSGAFVCLAVLAALSLVTAIAATTVTYDNFSPKRASRERPGLFSASDVSKVRCKDTASITA